MYLWRQKNACEIQAALLHALLRGGGVISRNSPQTLSTLMTAARKSAPHHAVAHAQAVLLQSASERRAQGVEVVCDGCLDLAAPVNVIGRGR